MPEVIFIDHIDISSKPRKDDEKETITSEIPDSVLSNPGNLESPHAIDAIMAVNARYFAIFIIVLVLQK